jgi:hypothetical protein
VTAKLELVAFDTSGDEVVRSPHEQTGDFSLVATSNSELWTVGAGATCNSAQELVEVNAATGISHVVTALKTPVESCLYGANGSQLASVNRSVFVLDPTDTEGGSLLYRVET